MRLLLTALAAVQENRLEGPVYFRGTAIDSRPDNLFAGVIISVLIGPALLFGFLIYERCYLAKKSVE